MRPSSNVQSTFKKLPDGCDFVSPLTRNRKCDDGVARAPRLAVTTGGDDDVLSSIGPAIGHRRCFARRRKLGVPHLSTGLDVERAKLSIDRRSHEDEPARSDNAAAKIGCDRC